MKRLLFVVLILAGIAHAQQPTSFTYQGKLNVNTVPANGVYDFSFTVSDVATGTGAVDSMIFVSGVQVTNGIFTAELNFPASVWTTNPGPRYLSIAVRTGSNPTYFVLDPRQPIGSTPYSSKALTADTALNATNAVNATNATTATTAVNADNSAALGGFPSVNFMRLNPLTPQLGGFAVDSGIITGNLTAATFNATTQFNLGGQRFLSSPGNGSLFAGWEAGNLMSTGNNNVAFGQATLYSLTSGSRNTALGATAGFAVTGGLENTFVGGVAGTQTTDGTGNTFLGFQAGQANIVGNENVIVGSSAGFGLSSGSGNTLVGSGANVASPGFPNASAFGYRAMVSAPNSLILGSINGVNNATADTNVGIGTTSPLSRLDVRGNVFVGLTAQPTVPPAFLANARALWLANDDGDANNSVRIDGSSNNLYLISRSDSGAATGGGIVFRTAPAGLGEIDRVVVNPTGELRVNVLGASGATPVCRNANNELATCTGPLAEESKKNDEQDALILRQKEQIERQQKEIDALKALVCSTNTTAAVCRAKE